MFSVSSQRENSTIQPHSDTQIVSLAMAQAIFKYIPLVKQVLDFSTQGHKHPLAGRHVSNYMARPEVSRAGCIMQPQCGHCLLYEAVSNISGGERCNPPQCIMSQ